MPLPVICASYCNKLFLFFFHVEDTNLASWNQARMSSPTSFSFECRRGNIIQIVPLHNNLFYSCIQGNRPRKPGKIAFRYFHIIYILYYHACKGQSMYTGTQQKYLVIHSYRHENNNYYFEKMVGSLQIGMVSVGTGSIWLD